MPPDDWQQLVLDCWLGRRKVGSVTRWAADRAGLAVSRQNGKNAILEMVELFKLVDMGRRILHSAHQVKTSREAFLRLAGFFEDDVRNPDLAAMVASIRYANGQESINLVNGGMIAFIARSKSSGRGFTVDDLVCDEAQELSDESLEALLPTLSAAPSHDPQIILTGTPPSPYMNGEVFERTRADAFSGRRRRLAWVEWALTKAMLDESEDGLDDVSLWARTNPSLGTRIMLSSIENERALMDDAGFARERLGMWQAAASIEVIPQGVWLGLSTSRAPMEGARRVFAVDMTPDRARASVAVACDMGGGCVHVELAMLADTSAGPGNVLEWLSDPNRRRTPVVIDSYSPAAALQADLEAAKVRVTVTGTRQLVEACGLFMDRVNSSKLSHYNQEQLNKAVAAAGRRRVGTAGGWAWNRRSDDSDISPLVAATLAVWGLASLKKNRSGDGRVSHERTVSNNRKAVVM